MPRKKRRRSAPRRATSGGERAGRVPFPALFLAFALVSLFVYRGAISGPFVSDDVPYIAANPYVQGLSGENIAAILDPTGPTIPLAANYSPVHLLLHALEWQVFGSDVRGYHVVNILVHALGSALLALLLRRSGVSPVAAVGGAVFFLLHPANVEAVAWISQLKTTSAFALALGALLAHPRRPLLGTLLFSLALLAKPLAAFALPVVAVRSWMRGRLQWGWLGAWALAFAALAFFEAIAFRDYGVGSRILHADPLVWARTIVALVARYLAMAATSHGVSAFHELPRVLSWLDPWWLAGLAASIGLGWRTLWVLRRRREEAAWWLWAAISFAPVSQIFPFDFSMADRYLYFILPGLIGGSLLAAADLLERHHLAPLRRPAAGVLALALAAAVGIAFAARSSDRAALWRSAGLLSADAVAHYPEGRQAHLVAARRAAEAGDSRALARELRAARKVGFESITRLLNEPLFVRARVHPEVEAVFRDLAAEWIGRLEVVAEPNQTELNVLALAHETRGEIEPAIRAVERALAMGGPDAPLFRARLAQLRAKLATRPAPGAEPFDGAKRGRDRVAPATNNGE